MEFIKNNIFSYLILLGYEKSLNIISNDNTRIQLKKYLFSLKHSFFLGTISVFLLNKIISKKLYYNLLGYSNGYLLYDLIKCIESKDYQMIFHHIFMMITLVSPQLVSDNYIPNLDWIIGRIYICEFTNIFLYSYIMLSKLKYNNQLIMDFLKISTIISYIFLRVYNKTYIQYYLYVNEIYLCFYLMAPITLLNYYWFKKIISKSIRR